MELRKAVPAIATLLIYGAMSRDQVSDRASFSSFVVAGERAYGLVLPVKFCCAATVIRAEWATDGSYILLHQLDSKATSEDLKRSITGDPVAVPRAPRSVRICFWNRKSEKLTEVLSLDPKKTRVEREDWLNGADVALVYLREEWTDRTRDSEVFRLSLVELNARTNAYKVLWTTLDEASDFEYSVSPKLPFAVVYGTPAEPTSRATDGQVLQVYRPGSGLGAAIDLPKGAFPEAWTVDGKKLVLGMSERNAAGKREHKHIVFDPFTGKTSPAQEVPQAVHQIPNYAGPEDTMAPLHEDGPKYQRVGELRLQPEFTSPEIAMMRPVYLAPVKDTAAPIAGRKPSPGLLVTAEAEFAQISPAKDAVLYVTRGVALIRPMLDMDLGAYQKAELESAKQRAKQVALGMLMYAGDYDDTAVPNTIDWQELVYPYVKDSTLFDGFQYTFSGGSLMDVANPTVAEFGYIPVTGGRVVAYLDGHVGFVPNPAALLGEVREPWEEQELKRTFAFDSG